MYIYKFTHIATGRCYIGQTIQHPNNRKSGHLYKSKNTPKTYHFHNALNLYGIDAFTFEVIAVATTLNELNKLEEEFVILYDSINNGFNIRNPGDNKLHNQESIIRMQDAQRAAHARRRLQNGGIEKHTKKHKNFGLSGQWYWSDEQKQKLKGLNTTKIICPHCKKEGQKTAMTRWHFDNCKEKTK